MLERLFLIATAFLLSFTPVSGTHVIGGEIYYDCLNPSIGLYQFTVKLYRDCYAGVPPFDDPIYVSIYDSAGNLFAQMDMAMPPSDTLENATYSTCLFAPPNICIEEAVYEQTFLLPPGKYDFTYQRCCRNQGIVNIPNPTASGFGFDMVVPDTGMAICNSSPSYNNYPPTIICLDVPFEYDHSASEPDGDSLVYYLCAPQDYNYNTWGIVPNPSGPASSNLTIGYLTPFDSLYPISAAVDSFRIDPETGLLTGTPTQVGRYVVAICVSEYRNGVLLSTNSRDFQFNVASCLDDPLAQFTWLPDSTDSCQVKFTYSGNTAISFDWNFGVDSLNSDTSDLEDPSYTFPGTGTYTVSLIVNETYSCEDTFALAINITSCPYVSVFESEQAFEKQLHLYPNPTNESFTLDFHEYDIHRDIQMTLYRMDGSPIFKKVISTPATDNLYTLDLKGVSKGMYLLKVVVEGEVFARKVILQ